MQSLKFCTYEGTIDFFDASSPDGDISSDTNTPNLCYTVGVGEGYNERIVIIMTAVKEQLIQMVPRMPVLIPNLSEDKAQQILNIFITVTPEDTEDERKALAKHRRELLNSDKYVRPSGRTHKEIDAEIREMRSDRL